MDSTKRMLRDAGLDLVSLGSYYRPESVSSAGGSATGETAGGSAASGDADRETRPASVLRAAAELEAPLVRIWAGSRNYDEYAPHERESIYDQIRLFADDAAKAGIRIVLERHNKTLTNSWMSAGEVIRAIGHDAVALCYQVPYPVPAAELSTMVADDCTRLLPLCEHAHLQNYTEKPDGSLPRTLLDRGVVDYAGFSAAARAAGYSGWAMVEFIPPERGDLSEDQALSADLDYIRAL
jgi:sugar phosphate isomerase/epimerase